MNNFHGAWLRHLYHKLAATATVPYDIVRGVLGRPLVLILQEIEGGIWHIRRELLCSVPPFGLSHAYLGGSYPKHAGAVLAS
jgi:hypothetical protein